MVRWSTPANVRASVISLLLRFILSVIFLIPGEYYRGLLPSHLASHADVPTKIPCTYEHPAFLEGGGNLVLWEHVDAALSFFFHLFPIPLQGFTSNPGHH